MKALLADLHSNLETVRQAVRPPHRVSLDEAVSRVIERNGWADVPPLPSNPPPLPREPQPYHPITRPLTFRQGGYNR